MSDERGVSEVLGSILVFALVIAVLVIVQVAGVPAANQQIEFEHNNRVQADFQEFDRNVERAAVIGAEGSTSLESGVRYPPRLFLINPGPAAGTVTTSASSNVVFQNVQAVNEETDEYFDSLPSDELVFSTRSLSYAPSYNEYGNAPTTTYENGVLFNSDGDKVAVTAQGSLVSGNRISLTVLDGSVSESSTKSVSLETVPISGPAQSISIQDRADDGTPITIKLQTSLSQTEWDAILDDEPYVTGIGVTDGTLTIELDPSVTYDLRLSKVGIGKGATEEGTAYLTKAGDTNPVINRGGTQFTVEARDRFNNPISGEAVEFTSSADGKFVETDGTLVDTITAKTDENGQAVVKFKPDADDDTVTITGTAEFDGDDTSTSDLELVQYVNVPVEQAEDPADPSEDINPSGDFVVQTGAIIVSNDEVEVYFENRNSEDWELTEARINYYFVGSSSGNGKSPNSADLVLDGSTSETIDIAGDYKQLSSSIAFAGNSPQTLTFNNWQFDGSSKVQDQDFFIVTLLFDTDGDGDDDERGVYFVGPRSDGIPPTADAGPDQSVNVNEDVTFDGSSSSDPDGSISTYEWDVDNDGTYDLTGVNPKLSGGYSTTGDKTVTLRVTDADSLTDTDTMVVSVGSGGGSLSASLVADKSGTIFSLDASGSSPSTDIDEYRWDFNNDGTIDITTTASSTSVDCGGSSPPSYCSGLGNGDTASVTIADTDASPEETAIATDTYN